MSASCITGVPSLTFDSRNLIASTNYLCCCVECTSRFMMETERRSVNLPQIIFLPYNGHTPGRRRWSFNQTFYRLIVQQLFILFIHKDFLLRWLVNATTEKLGKKPRSGWKELHSGSTNARQSEKNRTLKHSWNFANRLTIQRIWFQRRRHETQNKSLARRSDILIGHNRSIHGVRRALRRRSQKHRAPLTWMCQKSIKKTCLATMMMMMTIHSGQLTATWDGEVYRRAYLPILIFQRGEISHTRRSLTISVG